MTNYNHNPVMKSNIAWLYITHLYHQIRNTSICIWPFIHVNILFGIGKCTSVRGRLVYCYLDYQVLTFAWVSKTILIKKAIHSFWVAHEWMESYCMKVCHGDLSVNIYVNIWTWAKCKYCYSINFDVHMRMLIFV